MPFFVRLRQMTAGLPGRGLLAWFALTVMVAAAAPLAYAQGWPDVCSSASGSALAASADGLPAGGALMHCPLCLPTAPPPAAWSMPPATAVAPAVALRPVAGSTPAVWRFALPPARASPGL